MATNTSVAVLCLHCGAGFSPQWGRETTQKFCSRACYQRNRWGDPTALACAHCGVGFASKSRQRRYCSVECSRAARRASALPGAGRYNRVIKQCEWCGNDIDRSASNFHSRRSFCDTRCMGQWQSANQRGALHPRWRGGHRRSYGAGWRAGRRTTLARAAGRCEDCRQQCRLHVHHRVPHRLFTEDLTANDPANLIALCVRCHAAAHVLLTQSGI